MLKSTDDTFFSNKFLRIENNLSLLGFSEQKRKTIYKILSAILNLGNIQFDELTNNGSTIKIDSRKFLCFSAALLGIDEIELEDALVTHTREVNKLKIK